MLNTNNAFDLDYDDDAWDTEHQVTFTCDAHGTRTEGDMFYPQDECCRDAFARQLAWDCFVEKLAGCAEQDRANHQEYLAGEWIGEHVLATEVELMEWAAARQERDDAEFDYGFNVLYKQQLEAGC